MMTTTNSTTDSKMIIGVCKRSVEVSLRHCNIWALERTYSKVRNFRKGNCESNAIEPKEEVDIKKEVGYGTNNEPVRSLEEEITGDGIEELVEMPRSRHIGYYIKHEINVNLIEGLIDNQIYNDSLLETRLGKMDYETYNSLPVGPMYNAILK
ncbi:hypothetical protein Tco_1303149 [Tanacetum coccineum]